MNTTFFSDTFMWGYGSVSAGVMLLSFLFCFTALGFVGDIYAGNNLLHAVPSILL